MEDQPHFGTSGLAQKMVEDHAEVVEPDVPVPALRIEAQMCKSFTGDVECTRYGNGPRTVPAGREHIAVGSVFQIRKLCSIS
jgi:hypothetical protein